MRRAERRMNPIPKRRDSIPPQKCGFWARNGGWIAIVVQTVSTFVMALVTVAIFLSTYSHQNFVLKYQLYEKKQSYFKALDKLLGTNYLSWKAEFVINNYSDNVEYCKENHVIWFTEDDYLQYNNQHNDVIGLFSNYEKEILDKIHFLLSTFHLRFMEPLSKKLSKMSSSNSTNKKLKCIYSKRKLDLSRLCNLYPEYYEVKNTNTLLFD